jgi:hypothetical protein
MEEVKRTELEKKIDILEDDIADISPEILRLLLKDKTTKKNILWCTKDYEAYGYEFNERAEMKVELITGVYFNVILKRFRSEESERELKFLLRRGFVMSKIIRLMKRGSANQMFLIHQTEHTG